MTDRELLELAAKAAGVEIPENWNPLLDDGDALRLLAAMPSLWSLSLKFGAPYVEMDVAWGFSGIKVTKFNGENTDRAAVIRRAIAEAAAEIGRGIE